MVVDVNGVQIGGDEVVMMAGPCTVESEDQVMTTAEAVARAGARILRGGAYKPSTSPYSFQGMGLPGLRLLRTAADEYGLKVVTEVMHVNKVDEVCEYADILQVGTRNAQNYDLLREVGLAKKPTSDDLLRRADDVGRDESDEEQQCRRDADVVAIGDDLDPVRECSAEIVARGRPGRGCRSPLP